MSSLFALTLAEDPALLVSTDRRETSQRVGLIQVVPCSSIDPRAGPAWRVTTSHHVALSAHDRKILAPGGCGSSPLRRCEGVKP
jgi:hypothetical protein